MGKCRKRSDHLEETAAPRRGTPEEAVQVGHHVEEDDVVDADRETHAAGVASHPGLQSDMLNEADIALLRMFNERGDLKRSLLDEFLAVMRLPERPTFANSQQFFAYIDGLPGQEFSKQTLFVPKGEQTYPLFFRDLVQVAKGLIANFNGKFHDPLHRRASHEGCVDFVDGTHYRSLVAKLAASAGEDAVLMPLVFNSGASSVGVGSFSLALASSSAMAPSHLHHMCRQDELGQIQLVVSWFQGAPRLHVPCQRSCAHESV